MKRIRVLVVDDSAFARKVIRQVLQRSPQLEVVGTAQDGLDALERISELQPDVVTLDLVMPNLDGVGFLQALGKLPRAERPRVVLVSMSGPDSDLAIRALHEGAFDIVQKPTALANDRLYELADDLIGKVEVAAGARVVSDLVVDLASARPRAASLSLSGSRPRHQLVVIGASTGGPQAVNRLLGALPKDFPVPIAVVVHIPVGFSQSLAEHLDRDCQISVREASENQLLEPGLAVLGRAGLHLTFAHSAGGFRCALPMAPIGGLHRPSLDVMFRSAAEASPGPVLALVLTGMGSDGLEGARAVHQRGGTVLTQAEPSSVVYGMPRVVWEDGIATAQSDIDGMAALLLQHV